MPLKTLTTERRCDLSAAHYCMHLADLFRAATSDDSTKAILAALCFMARSCDAIAATFEDGTTTLSWPERTRPEDFAAATAAEITHSSGSRPHLTRRPLLDVLGLELPKSPSAQISLLYPEADRSSRPTPPLLAELAEIAGIVIQESRDQLALQELTVQRILEIDFLKILFSVAERDYDSVYDRLLNACENLVPSKHSIIWLVNHRARTLTLRSQRGAQDVPLQSILSIDNSLTGQSYLQSSILYFPDIDAPACRNLFQGKAKAKQLDLKSVCLIPIRKDRDSSRDSIEAVLAIFPLETFIFDARRLEIISTEIGAALRIARGNEQASLLSELSAKAHESKDLSSYLYRSVDALKRLLRVEGISIFVWDEMKRRIELGGTTGIQTRKKKHEVYYNPNEGRTGEVFSSGEALVLNGIGEAGSRAQGPAKFPEQTPARQRSFLAVPIFGLRRGRPRSGRRTSSEMQPIGVIRCVNKLTYVGGVVDYFSDRDLDRLEYVASVMAPYLQLWQAERRRVSLLSRISHEILSPVVSIRGTAEHLLSRGSGLAQAEALALADDIYTHGTMLRMLSEGINIASATAAGLQVYRKKSLDFQRDVVEPCVDMAKPLARTQGLRFDAIKAVGPSGTRVNSDRRALQQALFNLLTNCVKYYDRSDRSAFQIDIVYRLESNGVMVDVSDHGIGVGDDEADLIFDYGYRGRDTTQWDAKGIGLGLFIARTIAEDLGGRLTLTHRRKPTTFRLELPCG